LLEGVPDIQILLSLSPGLRMNSTLALFLEGKAYYFYQIVIG